MRRITFDLLRSLELGEFDVAIHIVNSAEITRLNETFLRHKGPTDVITFDYGDEFRVSSFEFGVRHAVAQPETRNPKLETRIHGEIFVCIDEAVSQAKRFRTTWQSELARYVVHGVLHLLGYDDTTVSARRAMKREEDRLLKTIGRGFRLSKSGGTPKLAA